MRYGYGDEKGRGVILERRVGKDKAVEVLGIALCVRCYIKGPYYRLFKKHHQEKTQTQEKRQFYQVS